MQPWTRESELNRPPVFFLPWLQQDENTTGFISRTNVLKYFSCTELYDRSCNNERFQPTLTVNPETSVGLEY